MRKSRKVPADRQKAAAILAVHLGAAAQGDGDPRGLTVQLSDPDRAPAALAELSRAGIAIADFSLGQPSLDEVFLALTGHPATEGDGAHKAETGP